jgi:hypothetical protein
VYGSMLMYCLTNFIDTPSIPTPFSSCVTVVSSLLSFTLSQSLIVCSRSYLLGVIIITVIWTALSHSVIVQNFIYNVPNFRLHKHMAGRRPGHDDCHIIHLDGVWVISCMIPLIHKQRFHLFHHGLMKIHYQQNILFFRQRAEKLSLQ